MPTHDMRADLFLINYLFVIVVNECPRMTSLHKNWKVATPITACLKGWPLSLCLDTPRLPLSYYCIARVGQDHTFIGIYGVNTVF
jgi:hypothetical protein